MEQQKAQQEDLDRNSQALKRAIEQDLPNAIWEAELERPRRRLGRLVSTMEQMGVDLSVSGALPSDDPAAADLFKESAFMTSVLIVDDHESMRETLWDTLQRLGNFELAGSIANAGMAKLFCEKMHPDLVLMDVCTENDASGLVATEAIKASIPEIRVIIMTSFDEISYAPRQGRRCGCVCL